jgi:hypothetical protein
MFRSHLAIFRRREEKRREVKRTTYERTTEHTRTRQRNQADTIEVPVTRRGIR